jgi:hypothetical protein
MTDQAKPIFGEIRGRIGDVTIPALGVTVGTIDSWYLKRRENPGPTQGAWDFHAVLSYANQFYFDDDELAPLMLFTVRIGSRPDGSPNLHRLEGPFERTVLNGKSLEITGANLCLVQPESET